MVELQNMVFGKKRKPPTGHHVPNVLKPIPKARDKDSYRRPMPPAHAITNEVLISLPNVCSCGGVFRNINTHDCYEEDIPLPKLTKDYQFHLVTKYSIEQGVCCSCGKKQTATDPKTKKSWDLGGQQVTFGSNIRLLICHLVTVVGLSYSQVANLILSLYGLVVSNGEIANMLSHQHKDWLPTYNQLKADVRGSPIKHYDETPWKIQSNDNGYAWVMSAHDSPNTVFHLATSRGTRHARDLHGPIGTHPTNSVHITDDYGVYRNLFGQQQLCWAHLYRVIRDLRYNKELPKHQEAHVHNWYEAFASVYQDLRTYLAKPYDQNKRNIQSNELWKRIQKLIRQPMSRTKEPSRLTRLKLQLQRAGQAKLLTCLAANTPCDNNRAERDLRQLVLKRKRSFGSKTEQGAKVLSTVLSVCTTTWRKHQNNYFEALAELG
jgi:transposase